MHRTTIITAALWGALVGPATAQAGRGGPDEAGYEWVDSLDASAEVSYEWVDVPVEQRLGLTALADDGESEPIELGFDFAFYGQTYNKIFVGSNGFVSFQSNAGELIPSNQCPLPDGESSGPNLAIYAFYQDLDPSSLGTQGSIFVGTVDAAPNRRFVVTFDQVPLYAPDPPPDEPRDRVTFQIVLYETSNEIQVNVANAGLQRGTPGPPQAFPATIGVENEDGSQGVGVCDWSDEHPMPVGDYAVRLRRGQGFGLTPQHQSAVGRPGEALVFKLEFLNFSSQEVTAGLGVDSEEPWDLVASPDVVTAPPATQTEGQTVPSRTPVEIRIGLPKETASPGEGLVEVWSTAGEGGSQRTARVQLRALVTHQALPWQTIADLPAGLSEVELVSDGPLLYAVGGERVAVRKESGTRFDPVDTLYRWDPNTNSWDGCAPAPLPYPVTRGGACAMNGIIYYVGGLTRQATDDEPEPHRLAPNLLAYSPDENRWNLLPPPPQLMSNTAPVCNADEGKIYVYGGLVDVDGNGLLELPSEENPAGGDTTEPIFQVYDALAQSWRDDLRPLSGTNGPVGRSHAAMALSEGLIFLAGGQSRVFEDNEWVTYYHSSASFYEMATDRWTAMGGLETPNGGPKGVLFRDQFCVLGGLGTDGSGFDNWQCYHPPLWITQASTFSYGRAGLGATVAGDQIVVAGGAVRGAGQAVDRAEQWPPSIDLVPPAEATLCLEPGPADDTPSTPEPEIAEDGPPTTSQKSGGGGCTVQPYAPSSGRDVSLLVGLLVSLVAVRSRRRRSIPE